MQKIKLFISHAHDDALLAAKLVDLIRACVKIDSTAIRCSSAPGYGLPLGHISRQIRKELRECNIVLGLITENSIRSDYVAIELGAGWYLDKAWALLGSEVDYADVPGPLKEHNALLLSNADSLFTMIKEVCQKASLQQEGIDLIKRKIDEFVAFYLSYCQAISARRIKINLISGADSIFKDAINKVKAAKKRIRATNFGSNSLPPPKEYTDAVSDKLRESIKLNSPIEFKIIGSSNVGLQDRMDQLPSDIKRLVSYKVIDIQRVMLNILIVDDVFAQISFPEVSVDTHFRACISISDSPELVRLLIDWYDGFLWG